MCLKKVFDSGKSSSKVISNAKTRFIFTRFFEHKIISRKSSIFFCPFLPKFFHPTFSRDFLIIGNWTQNALLGKFENSILFPVILTRFIFTRFSNLWKLNINPSHHRTLKLSIFNLLFNGKKNFYPFGKKFFTRENPLVKPSRSRKTYRFLRM